VGKLVRVALSVDIQNGKQMTQAPLNFQRLDALLEGFRDVPIALLEERFRATLEALVNKSPLPSQEEALEQMVAWVHARGLPREVVSAVGAACGTFVLGAED
jgi:hypothetical protein